MKASHQKSWNLNRFDAYSFAEAGASLEGSQPLESFERLKAECHPEAIASASAVQWTLRGEVRPDASGRSSTWLRLQVQLALPVGCQRCLGPVVLPLEVDRWFRFVADEATAEAQDDDSEEDVLALEPKPNLMDLVEDELLMAIPLVPMHDQCPQPLATRQEGPDEAEADPATSERPNPFEVLAQLKK